MKVLRLFLIALILQPCPVCWGHGVSAISELAQTKSEQASGVTIRLACCSPECHLHDLPGSTEHDEQHDCPCVCHISDLVFAQTTPAVNLRCMTTAHSMLVVEVQTPGQLAVLNTVTIDTSQSSITVPLRI